MITNWLGAACPEVPVSVYSEICDYCNEKYSSSQGKQICIRIQDFLFQIPSVDSKDSDL